MPNKAKITTGKVFCFLDPLDKPFAGNSAKVRKEVRSHVTKQQHRTRKHQENESRRARFEARTDLQQSLTPSDKSEEGIQRNGSPPRVITELGKEEVEGALDGSSSTAASPSILSSSSTQQIPNASTSADLFNPLVAAHRGGSLAFQLYILNDPTNNIGSILHDMEIDIRDAFINYQQDSLSNAQIWEHQFIPLTKPGTAGHLLPSATFSDPTLAASSILLGLSLLCYHQKPAQHISNSNMSSRMNPGILQLRGHVIRSINEALNDSSRAISDHVITAVILLAKAEALQGLKESYPVHMAGVMNMVNLRGGYRELGFEGGLEAFILWQDVDIAKITGERKTYGHLAKNRTPLSSPMILDGGNLEDGDIDLPTE